MGPVLSCFRKRQRRRLTLLLVGLDNAGKTVAGRGLAGESVNSVVPTVGFSIINLYYGYYDVKIYDLGGSSAIRGIWCKYFTDVHGVIFVIDASDMTRIAEAKTVLEQLLSSEKIAGKPVLLLANKQDYESALDEIELIEKLELELLVNKRKCPTLVECCAASNAIRNSNQDSGITRGYEWLVNYIDRHYDEINNRVEKDVQVQKTINRELLREQFQNVEQRKHDLTAEDTSKSYVTHGSFTVNGVCNVASSSGPPMSALILVREQLMLNCDKKLSRTLVKNKTYPVHIYNLKRCHSAYASKNNMFHGQQRRVKSAVDNTIDRTCIFKAGLI